MYTTKSCCPRDGLGRAKLRSSGLGADEYQGQSKIGGMTNQILGMNPNMMVTSVLPGFAKNALSKMGVDLNPISVALAPFTMGLSLLPGISGLFGGMFKKATHMGDCMKWWNDANINGMAASIRPIPFDFEDYMSKNFPQFARQYQVMKAGGQWGRVGVSAYLSNAERRERIATHFRTIVYANPDLMKMHCAVQERAETGFYQITTAQVDKIWAQVKGAAAAMEFQAIPKKIDKLVEPFKVKETWGQILQSRNANMLIQRQNGAALAVPPDMIGVRHGAFIQVLKTAQHSDKPVTFGRK